jgi:fibro-slime domain-containing protein
VGSVALTIIIRDFKLYDAADPSTNPDFHNIECDRDVAASTLGDDGKPVYQTPTNTLPTFGKAVFDQWYRDVPGTNIAVDYPLTLTATSDGLYEYDSRKTGTVDTSTGVSRRVFLPIDDGTPYATAFGNQGSPHNLGFTGELHAVFTFPGQGSLQVRGDDDLYIFIGGNLAVNLGGIHAASTLDLDLAGLGLTPGNDYNFDLFYAERAGKTGELLLNTSLVLRPAMVK